MTDKIIIGSEGMGSWGQKITDYIIRLAYPNKELIYENTTNCNLIVKSHFDATEPKWNMRRIPYIYWSGESFPVRENGNHSEYIHLATTLKDNSSNNYFYLPYCVEIFNYAEYKISNSFRLFTNKERPYFMALCASNRTKERVELFDLLVQKDNTNSSYALGRYSGNDKCMKKHIPGGFNNKDLIEEYSHFRFVLTMENKIVKGYITEKIINTYKSGAIPIYWGDPQIVKTYFNPKSFICVNDFNSFDECADYIVELDKDPERVRQMMEEPVFNNGEIPDIFRVGDFENPPEYYKNISAKLKQMIKF